MKQLRRVLAIISIFGTCSQALAAVYMETSAERSDAPAKASLPENLIPLRIELSDPIQIKKHKLIEILTHHRENLDALTAQFPLIQIYEGSYTSIEVLQQTLRDLSQPSDAQAIVNLLWNRRPEIITEWLQCKVEAANYETEIARICSLLETSPILIMVYALECAVFLTNNQSGGAGLVRDNLVDDGSFIQSAIIKLMLIAGTVPPQFKEKAVALADKFTRLIRANAGCASPDKLEKVLGVSSNKLSDIIVLFPGCRTIEDRPWQFSNGVSRPLLDRYTNPSFCIFCHRKYEFVCASRGGRTPEHTITPDVLQKVRESLASNSITQDTSHFDSECVATLGGKSSGSSAALQSIARKKSAPKKIHFANTKLTAKLMIASVALMLIVKILYECSLHAKADKSLKTL